VMNLHGQDHPMQMTVNLHPAAAGTEIATHFNVPFVAWGMKDPSTFIFRVDKEVALDIDAKVLPATNQAVDRPVLRPSEMHKVQ